MWVFEAWDNSLCDISHPKLAKMCHINTQDHNEIIDSINFFNQDEDCIWIIVQLPLPQNLQNYKPQILSAIDERKDIDGLGWKLFGLSSIDLIDYFFSLF